ncbi:MAG: tetrahydrofolate dehydrogenase/cyclohydrolase catalytic domain-containing protein [Bacillota bacterium]
MKINGNKLAKETKAKVKAQVEKMNAEGIFPCLLVVLVGDDEASKVYVASKGRDCVECGIEAKELILPKETTEAELLEIIDKSNKDETISGILVQMPLPKHINESKIIDAIAPEKDVDCFTKPNIGKVFLGEDGFKPCTPQGCIDLVRETGTEICGKHVVIVGRSNIVGKPLGLMMLKESATVTYTHSRTKDLKSHTLQADILIVAVGVKHLITADMVKEGAVVIDVGMNRENGKLYGDVDYENVEKIASFITPVPGGVGPMTRAILMQNTANSALKK